MRKLITISISLLCLFGSVQTVHGCVMTQDLNKMDVAFAKYIFVGKIVDLENDRAVFEIIDMISGDYPEERMVVGLGGGFPKSVDGFIKSYGYFVRLAVTTPEQVGLFCPDNEKPDSKYNFMTGPCEYPIRSLNLDEARELPQILHNDCASPYFFRLDKYEIKRAYEEKHDDPDDLFQNAFYKGSEISIYQEISDGVFPLPWGHLNWSFESLAVDLYRKNPNFFDGDLSKYETDEALLTELGVNLLEISDRLDSSTFGDFIGHVSATDAVEAGIRLTEVEIKQKVFEHYIANIVITLKRMDAYIKIDPSFADRLLESD